MIALASDEFRQFDDRLQSRHELLHYTPMGKSMPIGPG
jgi:hypothetical protein